MLLLHLRLLRQAQRACKHSGIAQNLSVTADAIRDGPQDSILKAPWPHDASHPLGSADTVQSLGDQAAYCPPLTPLTQAQVFMNSPARGLHSTPPGYTYSQAPGFLNCPARGDFTAGYIYPTNHTPTVQTQCFSSTITPSDYTHIQLYEEDSVAVQAPLGSKNPARGPNSTLPGYTDSLLYTNSASVQAPDFSNNPARRLDSSHPHPTHAPYSNDTLQTPAFSGRTARRSDLASHPSLHSIVA